ncbi:hypothetical protein [Polaribacter sp. Z022]|uniref:hypothetical protein n=1 Tax=Polaribacter sp. Z022 TaxID=2927125 RepID=UPI00202077FB|nr:hypothetical protein [Polaribacter sp. Z022]MCL7755049.1 hypothetical protein [Polaribacter sp. Z022]
MKKLTILLFLLTVFQFDGFSQTEIYNLESQNLHKNVQKTIEHYYTYDKNSGGFVKKSVSIKRYNDHGNLAETYYLYNSTYSESNPTKKIYNYNSKDLLVSTKNISDVTNKYSSHYEFTYDKKGNLIKRESVSKDGSKYVTLYENDRKGRVINKKEYNKSNKLIAEVNYTYKGNKKTQNRTSFSGKDGSISGNYITVYKDNIKVSYKADSKYSNSNTTYEYDKEGNLSKSNYKGKTNSTSSYNYVYDKKDNWIKKHHNSGKYHYFYFREIYFKNGDVTGSSEFDRTFINRHGNFDNVAVVPLKKKDLKKKNNTSYDSGMPSFSYKNWKYSFVNMKDKVTDVSGKVNLSVPNNSKLTNGATVKFRVEINGADTKNLTYTVSSYYFDTKTKRHFWSLKSSTNDSKGTLCLFKESQNLRSVDIVGLLMVGKEDNKLSFYLQ